MRKGTAITRMKEQHVLQLLALDKDKKEAFGILNLNMPWEITTGCNAITAFQQYAFSDPS